MERIMLNNIYTGIKFTFIHFSSAQVINIINVTSHYTDVFIKAKGKILHLVLAMMFSAFFFIVGLHVIGLLILAFAIIQANSIGITINSKTEIKDHYAFFSKLIEFSDQAWFDMSAQNPNVKIDEIKENSKDSHFMNGTTKIPYSDLEGALQIFSVNEDDKPCYETRYMDIFIFTSIFDIK